MSTKPRAGDSLQLHVIPNAQGDFGSEERTLVDAHQPHHARRGGPLPSISRGARGTTPPPNLIPFAKPRALAELAASNPHAVAIAMPRRSDIDNAVTNVAAPNLKMFDANGRFVPQATSPATRPMMQAPRVAAPATPATRVVTGWTPPGGTPTTRPATPVQVASQSGTAWPQAVVPVTPPIVQPPVQQPVPVAAPVATPAHEPEQARWAQYEQLGLGEPKQPLRTHVSKLVVSAYRLIGFAILTIIVVVLVGYIGSTAFFYMSDTWTVPTAVSATDEKVVTLQAQLAEQQNTRDRIADELNQAERSIAMQQTFQAEFAKAIKGDLEGRKAELGRMRALASNASATRSAIKSQNSAYASSSRRRMAEEYAAGLIDRNAMLSGKFQQAQITSSNLTLAERQAEFETRAADLEAQTRSLDALLANAESTGDVALSYEVLRIKQEYEASRLDLAKAVETRDTLKSSLERQDKIVGSLKQSAWIRAINDGAAVAFVPYPNLPNAKKGASLYACKLGMVFCRHVGEVLEVLPGEVTSKHPNRDKQLRGQLVELKLDEEDADAAADDVLFVGGKPFIF
ncbi:MAG: hypothetical protein WKG01_31150 [Kofleriaceae bacterium]